MNTHFKNGKFPLVSATLRYRPILVKNFKTSVNYTKIFFPVKKFCTSIQKFGNIFSGSFSIYWPLKMLETDFPGPTR